MKKSRKFMPKLSQALVIALVAVLMLVVGPISACALPECCQDIRDADSTASDGVYTIYPNGNTQVFDVYCNDMAGTPSEYLELQNIGGPYNYAQYTAGGASPGTDVKTSYQMIRLDPATLMVDIGDQTFATTTGFLYHSSSTRGNYYPVNSVSYGVAFDCKSMGSKTGVGNIDLSGTPFAVIDTFTICGWGQAGNAIFSQDNQIVNLNGGGYCGGSMPAPGMFYPFNTQGGFRLNLEYIGLSNHPPVADAGSDQTVEQDSLCGASVTLDGSGSSDPDSDPLTYSWTWIAESASGVNPIMPLPLGETTITLVVNDGTVDSEPDTVVVTVKDTTAPVLTIPEDITVEQETFDGTVVPLTATATDICDAEVDITIEGELEIYPLGDTEVTFIATDDSGNTACDTVVVTVKDTTAPSIDVNTVPIVLWPTNHKYQTISISDFVLSVTDICDAGVGIANIAITSVSSDEPEDETGNGDGKTMDDIVIEDSQTVDLRSEREGTDNGRVYTINFEVTDASGNTATGSYKVEVPHDQSGPSAIDDGAAAGYTVEP